MPTLRLQFSGECRNPQIKTIGNDQAVEFQVMRKNYAKQGEEATFTWVRVTVFKPQPWQIEQCQEGKFVAGSGEFTLRSYLDKDGQKRQSADVRCQSFDIDGPRTNAPAGPIEHHAAKPYDSQANRAADKPAPVSAGDEPPF
jgi:single-stranded DNA-binding protein